MKTENLENHDMTNLTFKVKKWIDDNKDPRSAHWQAGLESILDLIVPNIPKGQLAPIEQMDNSSIHLFDLAMEKVDLCPSIYAAFLPQAIANTIIPPESAEELVRIDKDKNSCKILILRKEGENRIISAEISEQANMPGIDIFQEGAFIGRYDYENTEDCLDGLNKAVKAHAWKKETWQKEEILTYTLNWFKRVQYLNSDKVSVDKAFSFFHSPTLIRSNRVDGIFQLIFNSISQEYEKLDFLEDNTILTQKIKSRDSDFCRKLAQNQILELLNLIKSQKLMDFTEFSNAENADFQKEFARTEEKLRDRLMHLKIGKA